MERFIPIRKNHFLLTRKETISSAELLSQVGGQKPKIVVMTAHEVEEDIRRALNSGAKGYLLKGANLLEIRAAVGKGCRRTIHRYREHRRQICAVYDTLGTLRARAFGFAVHS